MAGAETRQLGRKSLSVSSPEPLQHDPVNPHTVVGQYRGDQTNSIFFNLPLLYIVLYFSSWSPRGFQNSRTAHLTTIFPRSRTQKNSHCFLLVHNPYISLFIVILQLYVRGTPSTRGNDQNRL